MKEKIIKMWREIKGGNFDYLFDAIAARLPSRLFFYYHGILVVTDKIDLPLVDRPDLFRKFVTPDDLDKLESFGTPKTLARQRLDSGYRAVIVGKDDEILSIVWGAPGGKQYPGEDSFVLYRAYTRKDARKQGLAFMAYQELYNRYKAEGKYRAYGTINRLNRLSFRVHDKFNFSEVGDFIYLVILGLGICVYRKWPFPTKKVQLFIKKPPDNEKLWFLP